MSMDDISVLNGKTIVDIKVVDNKDNDSIIFLLNNGNKYIMHHHQDCCENVTLEDINGSLDDLISSPLLKAECNTSEGGEEYESSTHTFYNLATIKGYVTIRWFGSSNGYYSESVDFEYLGNFLSEVRNKKLKKLNNE